MSTIVLRLFIEKYPDLYKNLIHNSKVLTTLFDVRATLRHIPLYLNHTSDTITGQSLFTKILQAVTSINKAVEVTLYQVSTACLHCSPPVSKGHLQRNHSYELKIIF